MRIVARPKIRKFQAAHPQTTRWLDAWWLCVKKSQWFKFADVTAANQGTDKVRNCYVFNLPGGNRMIVRIQFARYLKDGKLQTGWIFIRHVISHLEYDTQSWKKDC